MAVIQQLYDAAHKYGFDNIASSAAANTTNAALLGSLVNQSDSWGTEGLAVGQPGTMTLTTANGFTQKIDILYTSPNQGVISSITLYRTQTNELLFSQTGAIGFTPETWSTVRQPQNALSGNDLIYGNSFNNGLKGFGGNDRIDGGAGLDSVFYDGLSTQYTVMKSGTAITVTGQNNIDMLVNIERVAFDDKTIGFDLEGISGKAYRIYKAAFDREPDKGGLGYWIAKMDGGMDMVEIAARFIDSSEFRSLYGTKPTTGEFLTKVYQNVLDRIPDANGYAWWVNEMQINPSKTWEKVLSDFSESSENKVNVAELIGNGIIYDAWIG